MPSRAALSLLNATRSRQITTMTARDSQTVPLADGRVLGYAEYGLPDGYPVLFFHGFPSSRLEARGMGGLARRRGLRLIAVDRPGFGLSSFQPGRRITDWPADVQSLARQLHLPRFAVLGVSGGGPFALACAHALPPGMISAAGLFASGPPWKAGRHYMSRGRRALAFAVTYWPSAVRVLSDLLVGAARWTLSTGPVTRRIDAWIESLDAKKKKQTDAEDAAEADSEPLTTAQRRERLVRMAFEGFAQGARGFVRETQLLIADDWGFKFEDVAFDKVQVWHGAKDTFAPAPMIRYMVARLPHCEYKEFDTNHVSAGDHLEEVFSDLVPDDELAKHKARQEKASI